MSWLTWIPRILAFLGWYGWALATSYVTLIRDTITPGQASTPGIARLPTRCRREGEVTMLSILISLTPGTLTLGARGTELIWVHGMYHADADALRVDLWEMERRMLHAARREGFVT